MEVFSNLISTLCGAIFSPCLDCTTRKAAYISKLEDNVRDLKHEFQRLIEAREDVMRRVILDEQRKMQRLSQVQGWLSRVQDEETAVGELIRDSSQEIEQLCLGGYCSKNCKSSYKFGKEVAEKLQILGTLKAEGDFELVAERVPEAAVVERPIEPAIEGLRPTVDEVWRCLVEEPFGIIGLYGMGGVGKSTLLTQINNNFIDTPNDFGVVIWVVVSKNLQLETIQETIWKKIAVFDESWKNKSLEEKALDIFGILSKKKFVLLLDDLWERVDLTKVGVPIPAGHEIASKILFTTRSLDVCGSMEARKKFKVECLAEDEAWKLFESKVGKDTLDIHPGIPELAQVVAKECRGLPLALITIGRAMSCKTTLAEWNHAIQVLKRSRLAYEFSGMGKEVYSLLKFSYDSLSTDRIRSCLFYCSLFPEDYSIRKKNLVDFWIGEGFLDEDDESEAQNQGYSIIGILVRACLLEEVEEMWESYVKMHDVIRDMALWIVYEIEKEKEHNFSVHAGVGLREAPKIENWEGVKRMSLMSNKIERLSEVPTCPSLLTLSLRENELRMISNGFFQFMPSLKVLDLSCNSGLTKLPSTISELISLQFLDLSYTSIEKLPIELKALENLKYLGLNYITELCTIPRQIICNLTKLYTLRMAYCGNDSSSEDSVLFGGGELLVEDLFGLKYLNVLDITLRSFHALEKLCSSVTLQSCTQSLFLEGFDDSKSFNVLPLADLKHLRYLIITFCDYLEELKIEQVEKTRQPYGFHSLHTVSIYFCPKLRDLTWLVFAPNLKILYIRYCREMEEIIGVRKLVEVSVSPFAQLQLLRLRGLPNFKSCYWKTLPFPHLREIEVRDCPELKKLPLDFNRAKERKIVIKGEEHWWNQLEEDIRNAFSPCFKSFDLDNSDSD